MKQGDTVRLGDYNIKLIAPMSCTGLKNGQLWKVQIEGASETLYRWIIMEENKQ